MGKNNRTKRKHRKAILKMILGGKKRQRHQDAVRIKIKMMEDAKKKPV